MSKQTEALKLALEALSKATLKTIGTSLALDGKSNSSLTSNKPPTPTALTVEVQVMTAVDINVRT